MCECVEIFYSRSDRSWHRAYPSQSLCRYLCGSSDSIQILFTLIIIASSPKWALTRLLHYSIDHSTIYTNVVRFCFWFFSSFLNKKEKLAHPKATTRFVVVVVAAPLLWPEREVIFSRKKKTIRAGDVYNTASERKDTLSAGLRAHWAKAQWKSSEWKCAFDLNASWAEHRATFHSWI